MYLLDSDTCVDLLSTRLTWPIEETRSTSPEPVSISVVTYGEVQTGVVFSRDPVLQLLRWRRLLEVLDVIDVTKEIADVWAQLRGWFRRTGQIVNNNDLLIASTALHFGMTLVTRNVRQFMRIPDLDILVPDVGP